MNQRFSSLKVAIIGAGVVGLTTATYFQEVHPESEVIIIAEKFLTDTTSDGAAGIFRPESCFTGNSPEIMKKWIVDGFNFYNKILDKYPEESYEAGITKISGYFFSTDDPSLVRNHYLEEVASEFRLCTPNELKMFSNDFKYGSYLTTIVTECRKYLPYLMKKFIRNGGKIIERKIHSFENLVKEEYDLVFNCTGLGAKELCHDNSMTSIRGQVYKVEAPWLKNFVYVDYDTYIIPSMSSVTLGGVRQFGSFKKEIDKYDSNAIWERCLQIIPSLKNAKIKREWVGFRPYRSSIRVEKEVITFSNGKSLKIIHNYGHGGYGVTLAPGTSINAVQIGSEFLLEEMKSQKSKL